MDAWRDGDEFVVEFDLPGVKAEDVDLDVKRNVLTLKAERPISDAKDTEMIAAERPRGVFSRQLFLGDNLDTDRVQAEYDAGALRLTIPIAEKPNDTRSRSPATATARPSSPEPWLTGQVCTGHAVGATGASPRTPVAATAARIENQEGSHDSCGVP